MSVEERLLSSACRGDASALEELIARLSAGVYRFLAGMVGEGPAAEKAMQETCVRLARSLGRVEPGTDVELWAYGMARRVAHDTPVDTSGSKWPEVALRSMSPELREALVLRDVMGWDLESIARVLECSAGDVRSRLVQARQELLARRPPAPVVPAQPQEA